MFLDIRYQIELASIPKRHQKFLASELPESYFGRDVFGKVAGTITDFVAEGKGFYLWSPMTGTGKSTSACAVAMEFIIEQLKQDLRKGYRTSQLLKYVNVPDYLDDLRRGMNDENAAEEAMELTATLKRVPLVIFDDFASERISEWTRERLLTLISERYDNERSIIFTSNVSLPEVQVLLGSRIRSRIEVEWYHFS